jgi:hypothetical protein
MSPTPRQRVEQALRGGRGAVVPFTMYECMIPQCAAERELRNRGLCIVQRTVPAFTTCYPHVRVTRHTSLEAGLRKTRTVYETPKGTLSTLHQDGGFTDWYHERMFKSPADYPAIRCLIEDETYSPNYEALSQAQADYGEDAIFRADIDLEPLQALISGNYMDMKTFCVEWMDHRPQVLGLYQELVEKRRETYPLVADAPVLHSNYGGNVVPEIISPGMFEEYYAPHYNEAAALLHARGKLIGSHFDANCRRLAKVIGATDLDYIEAFTPAPDTDMTLGEARQAWPDKALWINFPSSVHLKPDAQVEAAMVEMLDQLAGLLPGHHGWAGTACPPKPGHVHGEYIKFLPCYH